ncbi:MULTISPECIES: hypothetical protein [unclassified Bradyrhizobium]|uniref:hypothetical protein n=1 Tax=unclassified Bradyrhizobium TaxID=2631580 RepID=UPI002FEED0F8
MTDDFIDQVANAKRQSQEFLCSIGIKDNLSNAVTTGHIGSFIIENMAENMAECPAYLAGITEGLWWTRYRGAADGPQVVYVREWGDSRWVEWHGTAEADDLSDAVAKGLQFFCKVEPPAGIA